MDERINLRSIYKISDNVVAREIEGELIIVPIVAGIGDMEDELFSLNTTGKAVWAQLDGHRTLEQVIEQIILEFEASVDVIQTDVLGLIAELKQRMLVDEITPAA